MVEIVEEYKGGSIKPFEALIICRRCGIQTCWERASEKEIVIGYAMDTWNFRIEGEFER